MHQETVVKVFTKVRKEKEKKKKRNCKKHFSEDQIEKLRDDLSSYYYRKKAER